MLTGDILQEFMQARKMAVKEYNKNVSNGQIGYLPSLEGIVKNTDIMAQVELGLVELPLKKIKGTYTHLRSVSFAKNFMPLMDVGTEFQKKWCDLCKAHLEEGIKHSIKVYEYLNWFYVIEGNKRVSVLKYYDAYSISANVIRLIPKMDDTNENIKLYYEFLDFNKKTGIFNLWLSHLGSFNKLLSLIETISPDSRLISDKYKYFEKFIYDTFRAVYLKFGGGELPMTTGDAFLEYTNIYGMPNKINEEKLNLRMKEFIKEMDSLSKIKSVDVLTVPLEEQQKNVISTITSLVIPKKKLKVGFAYARTIDGSGWTFSHELGRLYLENVLEDHVETTYIENVPEDERAYDEFKKLAEENDVVFTTSPIYLNTTLKCALKYPNVKFFNCSEAHPYSHVSNYYGRTYEPRFLTGLVAGAMTKNNTIGYVATSPTPEVISSINAFALGAKMVNPYAAVKVAWTNEWNSRVKFTDAGSQLIKAGADIICNRTIDVPHPVSSVYGVYSMLCSIDLLRGVPDKYLATPIWDWGIFYEKIVKSILNGTFKTVSEMYSTNSKIVNFWWGIDTGVVDIFYSKEEVPVETQKLLNLMKRMIMNNEYSPFTGPIYDKQGTLRIEPDDAASYEQILNMDWYVDNVELVE